MSKKLIFESDSDISEDEIVMCVKKEDIKENKKKDIKENKKKEEIKRKITTDDLKNILSFLEPSENEWETEIEVLNNIKLDLINQMKDEEIYPSKINELKKLLIEEFHRSKIEPGEAVGVASALSIGEQATQLTLNSFHASGIMTAAVTHGIPALEEIFNISKNRKTVIMKFSLKEKYDSLQEFRDVSRKFEEKYLDQVIESYHIRENYHNNISNEDKGWYYMYDTLYNQEYKNCRWSIRLKFNKLYLYQYKLSTLEISKIIEKEYGDYKCVMSPNHLCIIDVYIDTTNVETPMVIMSRKNKKEEYKEKEVIDKYNNPKFYRELINDNNKDYYFVKYIALEYILDIKLSGINKIQKVYAQKEGDKLFIETVGSNMREIINNELVEYKTVFTNDMWEIFTILGIEGTRTFLIKEINNTLSHGGISIDLNHVEILVDSMLNTGVLTAVNRYSIGKNNGILTQSSFEQSQQTMLRAPIKCSLDKLKDVSSNNIIGKLPYIGSSYMSLIPDKNYLKSIKN